uniref:Peroxidase n=1 Tax=Populus trichocarpa TaxID=3694 RepID=W8Q7V8_POPTR|nr:class III peroxidase [Populus trichocarpa]
MRFALHVQAALDSHHHDQTCQQAEKIVLETVLNASMHDPKVPARILRMFFHECFVRGCDASILLDSTPGNQAEKDGPPNVSVRSFYVNDDAKAKLEMACPRAVSCADIIAMAGRDVVAMSVGPSWNVLTGRKDGRVSKANDTINVLPAPNFNVITQLIQSSVRGLGVKDLVALSGGHTLGFSDCSSFEARLQNFSSVHESKHEYSAKNLKKKCPKPNKDDNAGEFLDSTSSTFDNDYYKRVIEGKGVFGADTRWIVESFARDQSLFFRGFAASMVKLGNVGVIENGEVRLQCRVVH